MNMGVRIRPTGSFNKVGKKPTIKVLTYFSFLLERSSKRFPSAPHTLLPWGYPSGQWDGCEEAQAAAWEILVKAACTGRL